MTNKRDANQNNIEVSPHTQKTGKDETTWE